MEDTLNDASSLAIEVAPNGQQRPMLQIAGLRKRFGAVEVLRDVSLAVSPWRGRRRDRSERFG